MLQQWTSFFILLFCGFPSAAICSDMNASVYVYGVFVCVCVCVCESALDREAQMVLAANAENNNKEHKSNRREAWEQLYPPVPTRLHSRTLALLLSPSLLVSSSLPCRL